MIVNDNISIGSSLLSPMGWQACNVLYYYKNLRAFKQNMTFSVVYQFITK